MTVIFKGNGVVWNPKGKNVRFINGEFKTSDKAIIDFLKDRYEHTEIKEEVNISKMKLNELKGYAEEIGVDLGEASTKAEILEVLSK